MSGGNIVTRLLDRLVVKDHFNVEGFRLEGEWRYSQRKLNEIVESGDEITISKAPFRPNHVKAGGEVKKMHNLLTPQTYGVQTNEDGSAQVESILGAGVFDNPKPAGLIQLLCKAVTYNDPEALVLDFFAGSGSTAHAVALQNAEDGGRRRVISVNIPEKTAEASYASKAGFHTVSDITLARLYWVNENVDGASDLGLRVFSLARSNFRAPADRGELDLSESTLAWEDVDWQAIASEVLLKEGVPLDAAWERYTAGEAEIVLCGGVAVVLVDKIDNELVEAALGLAPRVVVFLEDAFSGADAVKANAVTNARNAGITLKTV